VYPVDDVESSVRGWLTAVLQVFPGYTWSTIWQVPYWHWCEMRYVTEERTKAAKGGDQAWPTPL